MECEGRKPTRPAAMASTSAQHKCVLCGCVLESKPALQDHFRDHANGKIASRPRRPGYKAERLVSSREHVAPAAATSVTTGDTGQEPTEWHCDSCSAKFPTVTLAITHKFRNHPDSSTKHYCPYCGQQFPLKMSYELHVKSHDDVTLKQEIPCTECDAIFYLGKARDFHYNSVHSRSVNIIQPKFCPPPSLKIDVSQSGETRSCYYCHLCGTEYTVKYNLIRHLERHDHKEQQTQLPLEAMIRCNQCHALFFNQKAYSAHLLRHREGDLFVSSEAQRLMVVDRVDQDLDLTRIPNPLDRYVPGEGSGRARQRPPAARAGTKRPAGGDPAPGKSVRAS